MKLHTLRASGALMLGLSLCGGLVMSSAQAAPATPAQGANKPGKGMRGGGMGMKMMKDLNLTDAQKKKLEPIMKGMRDQMMAMRSNTTLTQPQKMAKMKAMRDSTQAKIKAILTPAQQKQMATMMAARKAEMAKRMGAMGRGPQAPA